ncbi:hypothetical protein AGOR_G00070010 [Albula goreensis]|uniref:Uncharacterized protein n=1 Tax=Albula goreensis TaxID=1534307 RepID=A0A8T3DMG5_9TELE|nr:hypothetical protein AGOR_G00070010 [Albula goreensis]
MDLDLESLTPGRLWRWPGSDVCLAFDLIKLATKLLSILMRPQSRQEDLTPLPIAFSCVLSCYCETRTGNCHVDVETGEAAIALCRGSKNYTRNTDRQEVPHGGKGNRLSLYEE